MKKEKDYPEYLRQILYNLRRILSSNECAGEIPAMPLDLPKIPKEAGFTLFIYSNEKLFQALGFEIRPTNPNSTTVGIHLHSPLGFSVSAKNYPPTYEWKIYSYK